MRVLRWGNSCVRLWRCRIAGLVGVLLLFSLTACLAPPPLAPLPQPATPPRQPETTLRLFIVYSADLSEIWVGQIRTGIIETLARDGNYRIGETLLLSEYRLPPDAIAEEAVTAAAVTAAIRDFAPDVVVTVGNQAAWQVIPDYPDPEQRFVFCSFSGNVLSSALNRPGVTGVLEIPYPIQTARLAANLIPDSQQFMVLGDRASVGALGTKAIFDSVLVDPPYPTLPVLRQTDDWEEWQAFVAEAGAMDFIILGKYAHIRDASGAPIPPAEVLRWTLLNSAAPVFGLWQDTVVNGAVGGLVLSGEAQGISAAQIVLQIVDGTDPAVLAPVRAGRNILALNLAAAEHWQVQPSFELLVTASLGGIFPAP